jgi:predicted ArsR family transcriptional regulator
LLSEKVNMQTVGERIAQSQGLVGIANHPMSKQLTLLVEKLNEMHYQARWEAGAEGPRVIFGRCPFAKIIEGHPELCKMDASMLEMSLARPITQSAKAESNARGFCPFVFGVG